MHFKLTCQKHNVALKYLETASLESVDFRLLPLVAHIPTEDVYEIDLSDMACPEFDNLCNQYSKEFTEAEMEKHVFPAHECQDTWTVTFYTNFQRTKPVLKGDV